MGPCVCTLSPIQLLWLNLVTDSFPALALGQEAPEKDIIGSSARKRGEPIINREMLVVILIQSVAILECGFAAFTIGISAIRM